ncbi:RIP metalloprotease RseP [Camelimonas abortus]|uniref:Zinc metalloprotease n=1 Tax=Camelimonas abortus TaxID=1017184 RepID=A0ABV7LHJ1_9HYPH
MDMGVVTGALAAVLGSVIPFVIVLTVVVFVHEFGHYIVGRWCGVGVKVFSIGFGRELFGWTDRRGVRWKISAIPLGGYVKFAGDGGVSSAPDPAALARMSPQERAESFQLASLPRRAAIVAAGPAANFLLAILLFSLLFFLWGRVELLPRVDAVQPGSPAAAAGFMPGDVVKTIDGSPVESFADMQRVISARAGEPLSFTVDRGGATVTLQATPATREIVTPLGRQRVGMLGVQGSRDPADVRARRYGVIDSLRLGTMETWYVVDRTFSFLRKLFVGRESVDQLSGPIRIAQASGLVAEQGPPAVIGYVAFLSVSIGLLNLFPIPVLDGGHLLFYAIEAVRGRPLSERLQEYGFRIGLALVLMLMILATRNDLVHLGGLLGLGGS